MGVVTELYVNLNLKEKPSLNEIKEFINELDNENLIDSTENGLSFGIDETYNLSYEIFKEDLQLPEEVQILHWLKRKENWLEFYGQDVLVIYLGKFHEDLVEEFESKDNINTPILLFIFKERVTPFIDDLYGDLPEGLLDENENEESNKINFGESTTLYFKFSSKFAPYGENLMNTKFGAFLKKKYKITYETGYS